jgi:hypothetical protein
MKRINFYVPSSGPYKSILDALIGPIQEYLPDFSAEKRVMPESINVGFFLVDKGCQVFIPHGIADKNYRNADKVKDFDYVFVSGPAWVDKLVRQGFPQSKILVGGYTKLDPIFQGKYKAAPRDKPRVLYAPTHGAIEEISLQGRFDNELKKLREFYDVIEAPHPAISKGNVTMQVLVDADVVISDAGSLVYEAWTLNKPVVFPSWLLKKGVMKCFPGSFEDQIYWEEIGYHAWSSTNLLDCVKRAYLGGIDSKAGEFIEGVFPKTLRGNSGEETANLLRRVAGV